MLQLPPPAKVVSLFEENGSRFLAIRFMVILLVFLG